MPAAAGIRAAKCSRAACLTSLPILGQAMGLAPRGGRHLRAGASRTPPGPKCRPCHSGRRGSAVTRVHPSRHAASGERQCPVVGPKAAASSRSRTTGSSPSPCTVHSKPPAPSSGRCRPPRREPRQRGVLPGRGRPGRGGRAGLARDRLRPRSPAGPPCLRAVDGETGHGRRGAAVFGAPRRGLCPAGFTDWASRAALPNGHGWRMHSPSQERLGFIVRRASAGSCHRAWSVHP
jgi:hypothetical protein